MAGLRTIDHRELATGHAQAMEAIAFGRRADDHEMPEAELWALADTMLHHFAEDAVFQASLEANRMLARDDHRGRAAWLAVAERIDQLQSLPGAE